MSDSENVTTAKDVVISTMRRFGYDGAIFYLVEVVHGVAIIVGATVLTVYLIRKYKKTHPKPTTNTEPDYNQC